MTTCICGHDINKHCQQGCMTIIDFDNDKFCPCELTRMDVVKASAEARAAQLEADNDKMQSYINEIRVALHTEKDELTIDAVRRVISERDDLARKLEQARNREQMDRAVMTEASAKIDELRQEARDSAGRVVTLMAELEQAQRKIGTYDNADRALNQALNEGDGVYRP